MANFRTRAWTKIRVKISVMVSIRIRAMDRIKDLTGVGSRVVRGQTSQSCVYQIITLHHLLLYLYFTKFTKLLLGMYILVCSG